MQRINQLNHNLTSSGNKNAFTGLTQSPPDGIFGLVTKFKQDTDSRKVNVSVGAYRDNNGNPIILKSVKEAEGLILRDKTLNKEYLPITGYQPFIQSAQKLIFGDNNPHVASGKVGSVQSLSGTGALKLAFEWIRKHRPSPIYIPNPTWGNHKALINYAQMEYRLYPYWNAQMKGLDIDALVNSINTAPPGSIFLLHPCAHNPTGCDPTEAQWKRIAAAIKDNGHLVLFDSAYQGFATGDFHKDAFSIRYFMEQDIKFLLCQSFSKNFGLYGERVGCFHAFTDCKNQATKFVSNVSRIIRTTYSNPPKHGAFIVDTICRNPQLFKSFLTELKEISGRIQSMRTALKRELKALNTPGNWDHITSQIGMFSFTGLNKSQCKRMVEKWHIYLLGNGRISMAGLNSSNVKYVAEAINDCVRHA